MKVKEVEQWLNDDVGHGETVEFIAGVTVKAHGDGSGRLGSGLEGVVELSSDDGVVDSLDGVAEGVCVGGVRPAGKGDGEGEGGVDVGAAEG
jgi:hypothetical protein